MIWDIINKFLVLLMSTFYCTIFSTLGLMTINGKVVPNQIVFLILIWFFVGFLVFVFFRKNELLLLKSILLQLMVSFGGMLFGGSIQLGNYFLMCVILVLLLVAIGYVLKQTSVSKVSKILNCFGYM